MASIFTELITDHLGTASHWTYRTFRQSHSIGDLDFQYFSLIYYISEEHLNTHLFTTMGISTL